MKIWRYMDLAKFIALLSNRALYFTSASKFNDTYEFYIPKVYTEESKNKSIENMKKKFENTKKLIEKNKMINPNGYYDVIKSMDKELELYIYNKNNCNIEKEVRKKFGVSCWHINEYENEALWKIYTNQGQGIAIETSVEKLEQSLQFHRKITFDKVRYEDFNTSIFEKNHENYWLYIKRKAFEYENEFRAVALLDENYFEKGCYINSDLDILIEKIHIAPLMPKYLLDSIRYLCQGELSFLQDRIIHSKLYDEYEKC
ncbi:DUF2971 domain-containing protein [Aliarcobacter thereius]|uniref:DUF2971 domain-containing protein n=1 Tax=Aliarcobacter thereius TaxID=544718 RepID=UPI000826CC04|nr:DUF2971 domain-containing protein [Aliarcobacter thereius]OCL91071.1 hypothetical protein AAX25_01239 [Aliarcobacter thereius]